MNRRLGELIEMDRRFLTQHDEGQKGNNEKLEVTRVKRQVIGWSVSLKLAHSKMKNNIRQLDANSKYKPQACCFLKVNTSRESRHAVKGKL